MKYRILVTVALLLPLAGWTSVVRAQTRVPTAVDAGPNHTCMVTSCGAVRCWGRNDSGQSNDVFPSSPFALNRQAELVDVTVGRAHTCALDIHGKPRCWGSNSAGQSTAPSRTFSKLDAGGTSTCGIRSSGELECWGSISAPPHGEYMDVSVGSNHACAVSRNLADVRCWGSPNYYGESRNVSQHDLPSLENFVEVSVGAYHSCARTTWARMYCWGWDGYGAVTDGRAVPSPADPNIHRMPGSFYQAITASRWGTGAIEQSSARPRALAWGWPFSGGGIYQPPSYTPSQVDLGYDHGCMITDADQLICWGSNRYDKATVPALSDECAAPFEPFDPDPISPPGIPRF